MNTKKISVFIPTYNYAGFLEEAIDSVLSQVGSEHEVIVVDDGSTDNTQQILSRYEGRIRSYWQHNQGPAEALRLALAIAEGQYFLFLDADDVLRSNALECLRKKLDSDPSAKVIFSRYHRIDLNGKKSHSPIYDLHRDKDSLVKLFFIGKLRLNVGGALIDKEIFNAFSHLPKPMPFSIDRLFIAYALATTRCTFNEESIIEIRDHKNRLRINKEAILADQMQVAEIVFNSDIFPEFIQKYKNIYLKRLYASRARVFYLNQAYHEANKNYLAALKADPKFIFDFRNMKRFALSFLKK